MTPATPLVDGGLLVGAEQRAVSALLDVLVTAARTGRTVTSGEASTAAYGAWVPAGLRRALAQVSVHCQRLGEPDLTALVVHRALPRLGGPDDVVDLCPLERHRCWERWREVNEDDDGAPAPSRPPGVTFAEAGVLCPTCLTVLRTGSPCRCGSTSPAG